MTVAERPTVSEERVFPFHASVEWDSFNELAKEVGSAGLRQLEPGTLAHLRVKQDAFVLAREDDFQRLVGLAADAARLQQMVATLVEGIDLASAREDVRMMAWIRDVASQMAQTLRPHHVDLLEGLDDDDEPAPRGRRLAAAHRGG